MRPLFRALPLRPLCTVAAAWVLVQCVLATSLNTSSSPAPPPASNWLDRSPQNGVGIGGGVGGCGNGGACLIVNGAERVRVGAFGPTSMGYSYPSMGFLSDGGQHVSVPVKQGQLGLSAGKTAFSSYFAAASVEMPVLHPFARVPSIPSARAPAAASRSQLWA